jgi:hypothetical protein
MSDERTEHSTPIEWPFNEGAPVPDDLQTRMRLPVSAGRLRIVDGFGTGQSWDIGFTVTAIGRGARNDVRLNFGDMTVHRAAHAALETDGRSFHVHDVRRGNPVWVNGQLVEGPARVTFGDDIKVGLTTLRLEPN